MLSAGVRQHPTIDALAARTSSGRGMAVMVWNYQDEDVSGPAAAIDLKLEGLPKDVTRVLIRHYRIDQDHSNAYTAWKKMNSPQHPSAEEYTRLEAAGQLQLLDSPFWLSSVKGAGRIQFNLPLQALSLLEVSW
jgi:xylan 1,4-beta-xylosidase